MAEFLTTNGISYFIDKMIQDADVELYFLFPYLQFSEEFYDALKTSSDRGVSIIIVYANEDLRTEEKLMLGEIVNLEVYHSQVLNAKCCCSEETAIITSMDMHRFTAPESLEMGVLFNKIQDNDIYRKIYNEIRSVISDSKNMNLHKRPVAELDQPVIKENRIYHGFCIKCAMPISYNPDNPYCRRCAPKSNSAVASDYEGGYCHLCGTEVPTGKDSPLCDACRIELLSGD